MSSQLTEKEEFFGSSKSGEGFIFARPPKHRGLPRLPAIAAVTCIEVTSFASFFLFVLDTSFSIVILCLSRFTETVSSFLVHLPFAISIDDADTKFFSLELNFALVF